MRALTDVRRVAALSCVLALLAVGCGTMLSEEDRAAFISAQRRQGVAGVTAEGETTGAVLSGPGADAVTGGTSGGSRTTGGTSGSGGGGGGTGGQAGVGTCADASKGTDTGVSADSIRVATLADISGVQPGLFESAHQAARAATLYINTQGGICGRSIDLLPLDSKTDAGGNRAAMLEACQSAFAVVGSMSAFDEGSAAPGRECGIPDMSAVTTNRLKYDAPNTYPMFPSAGPYVALSAPAYFAKRDPAAVKKSAILWLNQAVTRYNAEARKVAWESSGFQFVYETEVQVLEANYTRFVQEMRDRGVQYVTMVSDYQSIVRLQKSMRQQGYVPKVRSWDSVAYAAGYLNERDVVEGSEVFTSTAIFEEANAVPEIKLYMEWLQRASPGATPDFFGIYTWSAFRLFQKLATQIGPELTRAKLLSALKATAEWGANGLHAPHRIGAKTPSTCNLNLLVKGGRFVRKDPASGFDCSAGIYREK